MGNIIIFYPDLLFINIISGKTYEKCMPINLFLFLRFALENTIFFVQNHRNCIQLAKLLRVSAFF